MYPCPRIYEGVACFKADWGGGLRKKLAAQGILTCCATRPLTYHLYADECGLLALPALVTSACLPKNEFFGRQKRLDPRVKPFV